MAIARPYRLAFDKSLLANIITGADSGKIIIANKAACKLLGYSNKELLTKNRSGIFDINEGSFKKMLKPRTAEGHSIAMVTMIKKSGRRFPCEITSAVFTDEDGIEKAITTITDRSRSIRKQVNIDARKERAVAGNIVLAKLKQRKIDTGKEKKVADNIILAQAKSDARLAGNNEWINYIGRISYDVMWNWDIITGQIYVGDSIKELFGYSVKNNLVTYKDFSRCLLPGEKGRVEKKLSKSLASGSITWRDAYAVKRFDGSIAATTSRAIIVRNKVGQGIRLVGAIQDISRLQELEKKLDLEIATNVKQLTDYKESFNLLFNSSPDVIYDFDLVAEEIVISEAFEKEFGYKIYSKMTPGKDWANHIHPEDKEAVLKEYSRVLASGKTEWKRSYRFFRADNSVANIISSGIILRNPAGKACRMILSMHDISIQTVLEERLEQEIKLKEKHIAEATEDAREAERSDIGKELHDNINQLLGASRLYLELAKKGGEQTKLYLSRSSEYTLMAIEEIRKLTKGLTTDLIKNLGLSEAIEKVSQDTMEVNPVKIYFTLERFKENSVNEKFKLNLFRIVQEQLNNILKHAKASEIIIHLSQNSNFILLSISDNGVGFDTDKKRKGIGVDNIISRAATYNGTADFDSQPGQGCILTMKFPAGEKLIS